MEGTISLGQEARGEEQLRPTSPEAEAQKQTLAENTEAEKILGETGGDLVEIEIKLEDEVDETSEPVTKNAAEIQKDVNDTGVVTPDETQQAQAIADTGKKAEGRIKSFFRGLFAEKPEVSKSASETEIKAAEPIAQPEIVIDVDSVQPREMPKGDSVGFNQSESRTAKNWRDIIADIEDLPRAIHKEEALLFLTNARGELLKKMRSCGLSEKAFQKNIRQEASDPQLLEGKGTNKKMQEMLSRLSKIESAFATLKAWREPSKPEVSPQTRAATEGGETTATQLRPERGEETRDRQEEIAVEQHSTPDESSGPDVREDVEAPATGRVAGSEQADKDESVIDISDYHSPKEKQAVAGREQEHELVREDNYLTKAVFREIKTNPSLEIKPKKKWRKMDVMKMKTGLYENKIQIFTRDNNKAIGEISETDSHRLLTQLHCTAEEIEELKVGQERAYIEKKDGKKVAVTA